MEVVFLSKSDTGWVCSVCANLEFEPLKRWLGHGWVKKFQLEAMNGIKIKNNFPPNSYKILFRLSILSVLPREILCLMIKWPSCIWNIVVYLYSFYSVDVAPFNQFISLFRTWAMLKKVIYLVFSNRCCVENYTTLNYFFYCFLLQNYPALKR